MTCPRSVSQEAAKGGLEPRQSGTSAADTLRLQATELLHKPTRCWETDVINRGSSLILSSSDFTVANWVKPQLAL